MTDNNIKQHNQLNPEPEADSELASRIAARYSGFGERVSKRITLPRPAFSIGPMALPILARKLLDRLQWAEAVTGRAGALADRIQRSVQRTLLPARPVEMAYFRQRRFMEDSTAPVEEGYEVPSVELTDTSLETIAPASSRGRPSPGGAAAFASAHRSRVQRTPVVAFSPSILESMGISPPEPTLMEEGIPGFADDAELSSKPGFYKPVSPPVILRRKPQQRQPGILQEHDQPVRIPSEQREALPPETRGQQMPGGESAPQPRFYKKGLSALSTLAYRIPFISTRKKEPHSRVTDQPDVTSYPVPKTGEMEQFERPVDFISEESPSAYPGTGAEKTGISTRDKRLLTPRTTFRSIISRKPLSLSVFRRPPQRQPVVSRELPLYKPASPAGEEERIEELRAMADITIPETGTLPYEKPVPATPESLAEEITGKYRKEETGTHAPIEQPLHMARKPDSIETGEGEPEREDEAFTGKAPEAATGEIYSPERPSETGPGWSDEEVHPPPGETFGTRLTQKYVPGKMTAVPLPFVQRSVSPDLISGEATFAGLADVLRAKYLPAEEQVESTLHEPPVEGLDFASTPGEERLVLPLAQQREYVSGIPPAGDTEIATPRAPSRILRRRMTEPIAGGEQSPATTRGTFERPDLVLARTRVRPVEEGFSQSIYRAEAEPAPDIARQTEQAGEEEESDTEAIAREVYTIIKRRLAIERERAGYR